VSSYSHEKLFLSQLFPTPALNQLTLWFIFKAEEILLCKTGDTYTVPQLTQLSILQSHIKQQHYLGTYGTINCHVLEVAETTPPPEGMLFHPFRGAHQLSTDEDIFLIAARAKQILTWNKATQFCGHCGHETHTSDKERAKICAHCHVLFYPQISPVVLALIWRKNEILLARSPHFQKDVYSLLAGFVEPGETLEQTVAREVKEEVGVSLKNIQYFGSQPWPFPSNLMIGFIAEYDQGEIVMDPTEIEDAQWFSLDALPLLPNPMSLSRRMIDNFRGGHLAASLLVDS